MNAPLFETHTFGAPTSSTITPPVLLAKLRVDGAPVPQGSMRAFVVKGRAVIAGPQAKLRTWRELIGNEARRAGLGYYAELAVVVYGDFVLPRPKRLGKTKREPHTQKPDVDKLARALLDALTGVVVRDDSQVVALHVSKRFAAFDERPGVEIELWSKPA
jgi:crossover junction endodeoxyribonuclease RusA